MGLDSRTGVNRPSPPIATNSRPLSACVLSRERQNESVRKTLGVAGLSISRPSSPDKDNEGLKHGVERPTLSPMNPSAQKTGLERVDSDNAGTVPDRYTPVDPTNGVPTERQTEQAQPLLEVECGWYSPVGSA